MELTTNLGASETARALMAAHPGEGITVTETGDGVVEVVFDNGARTSAQAIAALAAWTAGALDRAKATKLAELADRRWQAQIQGTYLARPIGTDDTAASRVSTAIGALVDSGSTGPVNWKFNDGVWTALSLSELQAMRVAGVQHVQACFDLEETKATAVLAAADQAALDAIDLDADWPA